MNGIQTAINDQTRAILNIASHPASLFLCERSLLYNSFLDQHSFELPPSQNRTSKYQHALTKATIYVQYEGNEKAPMLTSAQELNSNV